MYKNILAIFLIIITLSACSTSNQKELSEPVIEEKSASDLYNTAYDLLKEKEFKKAAIAFENVELEQPYSKWATKAQLMAAYSYYRNASYDDAIISLERYIKLHPGNEETPYAYYLLAISYYDQIQDVNRDQEITQKAHDVLKQIVVKYPDSKYANDARIKMNLTLDHLAGKEMAIGRYYLKRQNYQAAIKRFNNVITKYQTTSHIAEALYRLTECYTILGLYDIAQENAAVLGYNFPSNKWYKRAFNIVDRGQIEKLIENNKITITYPNKEN